MIITIIIIIFLFIVACPLRTAPVAIFSLLSFAFVYILFVFCFSSLSRKTLFVLQCLLSTVFIPVCLFIYSFLFIWLWVRRIEISFLFIIIYIKCGCVNSQHNALPHYVEEKFSLIKITAVMAVFMLAKRVHVSIFFLFFSLAFVLFSRIGYAIFCWAHK